MKANGKIQMDKKKHKRVGSNASDTVMIYTREDPHVGGLHVRYRLRLFAVWQQCPVFPVTRKTIITR